MSTNSMDRVFSRVEGEEEVTPPYTSKTRSFESIAAAKVLSGGIAQEVTKPSEEMAAAGLLDVQRNPSQSTDSAVDCLMSLSSQPGAAIPVEDPESKKRPAPELAVRRKLKMRTAGVSSPLARPENCFRSPEREPPVRLLSGATIEQLKLLAAAYKLCPEPTADQLLAIAERVGIATDALGVWFHSRKVLQDWVQQQPNLSTNDLKNMFYGNEATSEA